LGKIGSKDE